MDTPHTPTPLPGHIPTFLPAGKIMHPSVHQRTRARVQAFTNSCARAFRHSFAHSHVHTLIHMHVFILSWLWMETGIANSDFQYNMLFYYGALYFGSFCPCCLCAGFCTCTVLVCSMPISRPHVPQTSNSKPPVYESPALAWYVAAEQFMRSLWSQLICYSSIKHFLFHIACVTYDMINESTRKRSFAIINMWPRARHGLTCFYHRGRLHAIDVSYPVSNPVSHPVPYPPAGCEKAAARGRPPPAPFKWHAAVRSIRKLRISV